jgi:signal transduction histidine kinase
MIPEEILIVNDGSLLLKMVGGLLENKGYQLSLTDSPEEALAKLSTRNIVLAVIKLDGHQADRLAVLHMVKELNAGAGLVIVGDKVGLPAEVFEVDADDYVLLPCRIAEIWRRLTLCLESTSCRPEPVREDTRMHPVNQRVFQNLGLMFHDVRGLLTAINEGMKCLDRRLNGTCTSEVAEIFEKTYEKTRTLLSVSEEFLQKFRPEPECQPPGQRVDLREDLIDPVVQEFGNEFQESRITLENRTANLPPVEHSVKGDRAALKSVFRNLLHNAITHGGSGSTICIDVDEHPKYFRLQVQNHGLPMPPQTQSDIFAGRVATRGNGQGAGLGLFLGREVMRRQGGDISYEYRPQGTNFIMTMPRA